MSRCLPLIQQPPPLRRKPCGLRATTLKPRLPGPEITPAQLAARSWWSGPDIYVVIDDLGVD